MKKIICLVITAALLICCNSSNKIVWHWKLESRCYAQPILDGKNVYIVSQAGEVISGEYKTGKKNWAVKVNGPVLADPDYDQDHIYVSTQNGFIHALKKQNGSVTWSANFPEDHFTAPLTVTNGMLLVPSRNGTLYSLSIANGNVIWKLEGNLKYNTKVIVQGSHLFIGGWGQDFYCLNMDGSINWRYRASHVIVENALIHKNDVYFTAHDYNVYALDLQTGRLKWRFRADHLDPTELLLIGNELIFGSGEYLEILDPQTGKRLRKIKTPRVV
ncbi:MAG TPA: PQQ-binding-like beta-propeller repeat protein, partial [Acidobacteriota bacterium]|nr:PQQ-binding-like beta-propeller repeat protein [Acidobacteriota bacterium]